MRSAVNLAENTSTEDAGEVLLQSIAGLQVAQAAAHPDGVINDGIERLTEQLCHRLSMRINCSMTWTAARAS